MTIPNDSPEVLEREAEPGQIDPEAKRNFGEIANKYWDDQAKETQSEHTDIEKITTSLSQISAHLEGRASSTQIGQPIQELRNSLSGESLKCHELVMNAKDRVDVLQPEGSPEQHQTAMEEMTKLNNELATRKKEFREYVLQVEQEVIRIQDAVSKEFQTERQMKPNDQDIAMKYMAAEEEIRGLLEYIRKGAPNG